MDYLSELNHSFHHELLEEMNDYAQKNHVPIIQDEGLSFLIQVLRLSQAKQVLEIGSAIGYSALSMVLQTGVHVTTIERDQKMIDEAKKNIALSKKKSFIRLIEGDALELDDSLFEHYDVIFIDAAKAQYINFFKKYEKFLNPHGVIFTDNLLFHDLVSQKDLNLSKRTKQLVEKIRKFNQWVSSNPNYDTHIYSIGDGIALSIKK